MPEGAQRITKDAVLSIIRDIASGYGVAEAAAQAGLDPEVFDQWLMTPAGRQTEPLIRKAFAQADARAIDGLEAGSEAFSWQATKARIEFRHTRERQRAVSQLNRLYTQGVFSVATP